MKQLVFPTVSSPLHCLPNVSQLSLFNLVMLHDAFRAVHKQTRFFLPIIFTGIINPKKRGNGLMNPSIEQQLKIQIIKPTGKLGSSLFRLNQLIRSGF